MEVTTTSPSQLSAKLGEVKSSDIANDLFASHLAEASKPDREAADRTRRDTRDVSERDKSDESAATRDRAGSARDSEETDRADAGAAEEETAAAENTDAESTENIATAVQSGETDTLADALDETAVAQLDGDDTSLTTESAEALTITNTDTQTEATTQSTTSETTANVQANEPGEQEQTGASNAVDADAIAAQSGLSEQNTASVALNAAQTDTGAQQNNQASSAETLQAANRNNGVRTDGNLDNSAGTQGLTGEADDGIDLSFGDLSDGDGDLPKGERGLGHQMAEAMSGKQSATGPQAQPAAASATTPAPAVTPTVAPAAASAAVPSAGTVSANAISSDTTPDILGQSTSTGAATNLSPQNNNPVMVRFGALPGQAQATQVPNTAIAMQIAKHVAKGVSTFEIRLDPPEMGRIDVRMEMAQDGRVTAHLAVEKSETLDLLQRDAKALEQALRDAGLETDSDTLNFSLKQENEDGGRFADGSSGDPSGSDETVDEGNALMSMLAARQIEAAARGGVDVSI